ncbi:Dipeptidase 1 [Merluccius polli]|uniref:Dipeptidase n=1 Tax=Merluccius polli TaxID=89951 RepID=A0AA47NE26_MERPO|nr:Dipeptidase 1 [Merluccius polli]
MLSGTARVCGLVGFMTLVVAQIRAQDEYMSRAVKLMSETPLIDGHNDLPWQFRKQFNNQLSEVDLNTLNTTHTNIPKIKKGKLGAQFWSAYVPCDTQYKDAVRQTLEQIDVVHRMCQKYPETFRFATSSQDIMAAFKANRTASLIGVEGGHSLDSSLGTLRTFYQLGVRYLTLTHSCNTPWADNWLVDKGEPSEHNGLSDFGKHVVKEMNRLGMLIDLAHVPVQVMHQVLNLTSAPIIFSHSSAYAICKHKRNVPDDVLLKVKDNGGIVMINFYNDYVSCSPTATVSNVAGLEDVSKVPVLVAELLKRGWTDEEVKAALGNNLLRVLNATEAVRDSLAISPPVDIPIPYEEVQNPCRTRYGYPDNSSSISLSWLALLASLAACLTLREP